jgi:SlyX protein
MPESPVTHPSADPTGAALDARLVELETRLAFQEAALAELSDALAESRADTTRALLMLERAMHELRTLRQGLAADGASADPALEPPPPHY